MNTNLQYEGTLTLRTKTRTSVRKNHATDNLFRLLSTILCKHEFNMRNLPAYFMLYDASPEEILSNPTVIENKNKELLKSPLEVIREASYSGGVYDSAFTATLDSTHLKPTGNIDSRLTLGLLDGYSIDSSKGSILAAVEFDIKTYNIVQSGGQSFIKWVLNIGNKSE